MIIQSLIGLEDGAVEDELGETFDACDDHLLSPGVITSNYVKPLGNATLEKKPFPLLPKNTSWNSHQSGHLLVSIFIRF